MYNHENGCMEAFFAIIGIVVILVVSTLVSGFVLAILWDWFVVPVFDLPVITIVQAIGISMVVAYLTYQTPTEKKSRDKTLTLIIFEGLITAIARPLIVLAFTWIVQLFM